MTEKCHRVNFLACHLPTAEVISRHRTEKNRFGFPEPDEKPEPLMGL
jgi:hypothetical protein